MDLRSYYKKVRDAEENLKEGDIVVVSLETPEGGKEGVFTEVRRGNAARLLAEGRVRLASDEEASSFHETQREARVRREQEEATRRLQVMVIPFADGSQSRAVTPVEGSTVLQDFRKKDRV